MEKDYFIINNRYLADALAFLNFRYYRFDENNKKQYCFENSDEFQYALKSLLDLKKQINK